MERTDHTLQRLVSIVRRPRELVAFVSAHELSDEASANSKKEPQLRRYRTFEIPIEKISVALCPRRDQLLDAWKCLARTNVLDSENLRRVLVLLAETVPDIGSVDTILPSLPNYEGSTRFRPTAAHPRGFRGTKYQPPKTHRFANFDSRPYLCDANSMRELFHRLARNSVSGTRARHAARCSDVSLAKLETIAFRDRRRRNTRTAIEYPQSDVWKFPRLFLLHLWPLVKQLRGKQIAEYLRIFHRLELAENEPLLWAVSRLVSARSDPLTAGWCRLAERLPAHRRAVFVLALLDTEAYRGDPSLLPPDELDSFNEIAADSVFEKWTERLLTGIHCGVSVSYLLVGFRIAAEFGCEHDFRRLNICDDFPAPIAEELELLWRDQLGSGRAALTIWERCGQLSAFADFLRREWWRVLEPDVAYYYFDSVQRLVYQDLPEARRRKKWDCIRDHLPEIEKLVASVPRHYQNKSVGYCFDSLWCWDEPAKIIKFLPLLFRLVGRVAKPPFRRDHFAADALSCFVEIEDPKLLTRFMSAPDRSFLIVEQACARENSARLIARGLEYFVRFHSTLAVDAFIHYPKMLSKTAKTLGSLSTPLREQIVKDLRRHVLFQPTLASLPRKELCRLVTKECADRYFNPIPAKLKSWTNGECQLTETRLDRYTRLLIDNLVHTRLNVVERTAVDRLKESVPYVRITKNEKHALQLLGSISHNRRGLRRFLQAYWSGDRQYPADHPDTQRWYRSHPRVDRELWEQGIPFSRGDVTIAIELDPLEILKMGTYVGSCLALGGICADSPVAVLLDANKQILFARDVRGSVIGRQLVAISEEDQLVCFHVYPQSSQAAVKNMFRDYDASFAEALGLPLYTKVEQDDYFIKNVISEAWWDDGSWSADDAV